MQERAEIYGTEGAIFMNVTHGGPLRIYTDVGYSYVMEKASMTKGWTSPTLYEKWQFGFCNMINHFIRCLREEEECRSPGEFGKKVLEVVFAGYKSAEKGIAINLTG
jgi:predicted dehydrogenase